MSNSIVVRASTFIASSRSGTLVCQYPTCKYPNDDDAKYCIICGRSLIDTILDLSEEEEKSIQESWDEIKAGKAKEFESIDEYTKSLKD